MLKAFPRQNQSHRRRDLRSLRSLAEHQHDQALYNTPTASRRFWISQMAPPSLVVGHPGYHPDSRENKVHSCAVLRILRVW